MTNVLMLSSDATLLTENYSNTLQRHTQYAKKLGGLFAIVLTKRAAHHSKNNGLTIIPVQKKFFWPYRLLQVAKKICQKEKIDVITTQDPFLLGFIGVLLKRKFNIPLNVQIHSEFFVNNYWNARAKNKFLIMLGRYVLSRADTIRTVNPKVYAFLKQFRAKRYWIPIATDTSLFSIKKNYELTSQVVFVGRLSPEKNTKLLIKAMVIVQKKIPNAKLVIVGDGAERNALQSLVKKHKVHANFLGFQQHKELQKILHQSACLVLPSFYEGWGLAAIEALSCGVPVIMTNTGCAGEILEDGTTGYIVSPYNHTMLAKRILRLMTKPSLQKKFGLAGRTRVEELLNKDKLRKQWIECLKQTASE